MIKAYIKTIYFVLMLKLYQSQKDFIGYFLRRKIYRPFQLYIRWLGLKMFCKRIQFCLKDNVPGTHKIVTLETMLGKAIQTSNLTLQQVIMCTLEGKMFYLSDLSYDTIPIRYHILHIKLVFLILFNDILIDQLSAKHFFLHQGIFHQ